MRVRPPTHKFIHRSRPQKHQYTQKQVGNPPLPLPCWMHNSLKKQMQEAYLCNVDVYMAEEVVEGRLFHFCLFDLIEITVGLNVTKLLYSQKILYRLMNFHKPKTFLSIFVNLLIEISVQYYHYLFRLSKYSNFYKNYSFWTDSMRVVRVQEM